MPFTFTNYAGLPVQGDPFARNLVSSLVEGFQAGQLPFDKMRQARMQEQELLMKQLQAEALPEQQRLQRALMEAKLAEAGIGLRGSEMALQREQELSEMLRGGSPRTNEPQEGMPARAYGSSGAQNISYPEDLSDAELQAMPELKSVGYFDEMRSQKTGKTQVIKEGDPGLSRIDEIYKSRPDMRDMLARRGFKMTQSIRQSPETGQVFLETRYPSGKVEVIAQEIGKTESERELQKGIGKSDAAQYQRALEASESAESAIDNLNYIIDLANSPAFENVTGPVSNVLAKWTGSPEDRELLGNINAAVGNVVLDAAKSIKGAFTRNDLGLINSIKPNVSDFPEVFKGKLKAMSMLARQVNQRNNLIASYIRQGMNPEEAKSYARAETNFAMFKDDIDKLVNAPLRTKELQKQLGRKDSQESQERIVDGRRVIKKDGKWFEVIE